MRPFGAAEAAPGWFVIAGLGLAAAASYALVTMGPPAGIAVAAVPAAALTLLILGTNWGRLALLLCALALPLCGITAVGKPLPVGGSAIFVQDIILVLALASWAIAMLAARDDDMTSIPFTPLLTWPFVLFSTAVVVATMRGHYAYGASIFGQSLRLVLFAGIIVTLAGLTVGLVYRGLAVALYGGLMVTAVMTVYYIVSGTSQTNQVGLSTGGERYLGISTSLYGAAALFFALLNLRAGASVGVRTLHLVMAGVGVFVVVAGFGRAVFAAVFVVCSLLLVLSQPVRNSVLSFIPLVSPFVGLLAIVIALAAPQLVKSLTSRVSASPSADANVQWRIQASKAVLEQVRDQPLVGVGFGRVSKFYIDVESTSVPGVIYSVRQETGQDPHNGFLYLWAGGGIAALGSFFLLLAVYAWDVLRRYRSTFDPSARLILLWAPATLFAFLLNAATGTSFSAPGDLLTIWALLVLQAVVTHRALVSRETVGGRAAT
jgi:O-antigen ligase